MKLKGKVALVTGAGRGLGRGIALCLAEAGADVVVADILIDQARETLEAVKARGRRGLAVPVDVTSGEQVRAMVDETVNKLGTLNIAVNNAGVLVTGAIGELTEREWDRAMTVNAKGVFLCTQAELAYMLPRNEGTIINIASIAGKMGVPKLSPYCASKFAVLGFTNAVAREVAASGITVNAVCPGIIGTDMWLGENGLANVYKSPGETPEDSWERYLMTGVPQGVPQTAEDIGDAVVYLATADHVTGQALNVDGGRRFP